MLKFSSVVGIAVGIVLAVTTLSGCGQDPEAAAERALEDVIVLFNDMADAFGAVQDQNGADALAARIDREFIPRMRSIGDRMEKITSSMSEERRREFEKEMERRIGDMEERLVRAAERFMERAVRVAMQPNLSTSALEEAMVRLEEESERFERLGDL